MGMSASQSRLLSLTTRLSKLELQAQLISNDKICLATETTEVAQKYSDSLNKEKLTIANGVNSSGATTYADMNYSNLTGESSSLLTQYGVSDNNGRILVTQDIVDKYNAYNAGNGNQITSSIQSTPPNPQLESLKTAYTDAENALDSFGKAHVQGYTSDGNFVKTTNVSLETSYADSDVSNKLSLNPSYSNPFVYKQGNVNSSLSTKGVSVFQSFNVAPGDKDTATAALKDYVTSLSSDTGTALKQLLSANAGTNYTDEYKSLINTAITSASAQTKAYYTNQMDSAKAVSGLNYGLIDDSGSNATNVLYTQDFKYAGGRSSSHSSDTYYVNRDNIVKVFLAYFDADCAELNQDGQIKDDSSVTPYKNEIKANSISVITNAKPLTYMDLDTVNRKSDGDGGGTGIKNAASGGVQSGTGLDNVSYVDGTTDADKSTYAVLLTNYTTAKTAYDAAYTAANNTPSPDNSGVSPSSSVVSSDNSGISQYYLNIFSKMDDGYTIIDSNAQTDSSWLQTQLSAGNLMLEQYSNGKWNPTSYDTSNDIVKESADDSETAQAEAEYDANMDKIKEKDNRFDLKLKNIDTEHNAVQTEIDSVRTVIDKNIERSFKVFDG